ncbi:hypothetical protein NC651_034452 [Populus alba x Populus x berolinensis]|nr:hypothetical protein NC651_034452 [Populus alba x Populus x berolinensis]
MLYVRQSSRRRRRRRRNKAAWLLGVKTLKIQPYHLTPLGKNLLGQCHSFSENSSTFPGSSLKVRSNEEMAPGCCMDDSPDETLKAGNKYLQDSLDLTRELLLHHNLKGR